MKKILFVILAAVLIFTLAACNGDGKDEVTTVEDQVTTAVEDEATTKVEETTVIDETTVTEETTVVEETTVTEVTTVAEETTIAEVTTVAEETTVPEETTVVILFSEVEGAQQSTDNYFENGELIKEGSASKWMGGQKPEVPGDRIDGIQNVDNATFFGWASLGEKKIASFGYIFNGELVTDESFDLGLPEAEATALIAAGGENVKRYRVTVDFTGITDKGEYPISIVAIDEDGNVYKIDKWDIATTVRFVKYAVIDVMESGSVLAHAFDSADGRWLNNNEDHVGETPEGGAKAWYTGWIGSIDEWDNYKIGMYVEGTDVVIEKAFNDCTVDPEDAVINAATNQGATYATRYTIEECFPMAELPAGEYTVVGYIKTSAFEIIEIGRVMFTKN